MLTCLELGVPYCWTLYPSGARHTPPPTSVVPVPNSQRSLDWSLFRLSSSQLRTTRVFLPRVFFSFFFFKKNKCYFDLLGRGRWRISQFWGLQYPRNLLLIRALTYEAERTSGFGPAHTRSRQGLPQVVNGVSWWVRSKRKRRGSVKPATYLKWRVGIQQLSGY